VHEERYKVSACLCLAKSDVHILACSMPILDKPELGPAPEKFFDFIDFNVMFLGEFFNDLLQPDEACNPQRVNP